MYFIKDLYDERERQDKTNFCGKVFLLFVYSVCVRFQVYTCVCRKKEQDQAIFYITNDSPDNSLVHFFPYSSSSPISPLFREGFLDLFILFLKINFYHFSKKTLFWVISIRLTIIVIPENFKLTVILKNDRFFDEHSKIFKKHLEASFLLKTLFNFLVKTHSSLIA